MTVRPLLALLALFAVLAAVGPVAAQDTPLPKPEVLSEETIFTPNRLSSYDTLVIKDFTTDGAEYSRVDDEEKAKIDAMRPLLVSTIAESLAMQVKERKLFKNVLRNQNANGKTLILDGAITEFNAGSRALKFFVGFGAGMAYLKVKGRLIDGQTGKELATFEDRETGYRGAVGMESYEDLFPHQAKSLGENIANFIQKLY